VDATVAPSPSPPSLSLSFCCSHLHPFVAAIVVHRCHHRLFIVTVSILVASSDFRCMFSLTRKHYVVVQHGTSTSVEYNKFVCLTVLDVHQATYMITLRSYTFISVAYNKQRTLFLLGYVAVQHGTSISVEYNKFVCLTVLDVHQATYLITLRSCTFISVEYNKQRTLFLLGYVCLPGSTGCTPIIVRDNIT